MSASIVILKNNQPGPHLTREQVAQQLASGEASLEDLAFTDGFATWSPLREILLKIDGKPLVTVMTPGHPYAVTMQPPAHLRYGSFWERFFAYVVDTLILSALFSVLSIPVCVIAGIFGAFNTDNNDSSAAMFGLGFVFLLIPFMLLMSWLYYAYLESSKAQGTYGKQLFGLKVASVEGKRVGFAHASGRFFGKMVTGLVPFGIGYLMAAFTERKQALHDMIASTLVVKT